MTGLDGDDLDVDLHEVVGIFIVLNPALARGLGHLVLVADAGVRGKADWPNLPVKLDRLGQSQNLMAWIMMATTVTQNLTLTAASGLP